MGVGAVLIWNDSFRLTCVWRPVAPLTSAQLRALKTSNLSVYPFFPPVLMHRWSPFCLPQWQWNFPTGGGWGYGREWARSWIAPNGMQRSPVNLQPWGAEGVQGSMLYGELGLSGHTDISTWKRSSRTSWICRKSTREIRVESQPIWCAERKTAIQT